MKANILLEGEIGAGKTTALRTLLPEYMDADGAVRRGAGLTPFVLSLEPGMHATLAPNMCGALAAPDPCIHHRYIPPLTIGWDIIEKYAKLLNSLPLDRVLETTDPNKREYTQFLEVFATCADFVCDGCAQSFGPIDAFGPDCAVALDGLTGLTTVARQLVVGGKPILSRPEYNPVMSLIENFLMLWWGQTKCSAILLAHVDREINPVTGVSSITAHTIGQKLAPRIVKMPDEIIMAEIDERGNYTWATELHGSVLKSRRLPRGAGLPPDFAQLFVTTA